MFDPEEKPTTTHHSPQTDDTAKPDIQPETPDNQPSESLSNSSPNIDQPSEPGPVISATLPSPVIAQLPNAQAPINHSQPAVSSAHIDVNQATANINPNAKHILVVTKKSKTIYLVILLAILITIGAVAAYWLYSQTQYKYWLTEFDSKSDDFYSAKAKFYVHNSRLLAYSNLGGNGANIYNQMATEVKSLQVSQTETYKAYNTWLDQIKSLSKKHLIITGDQKDFANKVQRDLESSRKQIDEHNSIWVPYLSAAQTYYEMKDDSVKFYKAYQDSNGQLSPTYFEFLKKYDTTQPVYRNVEEIKQHFPTLSRQLALEQSELGRAYQAIVKISQNKSEGYSELSKFGSTVNGSNSAATKLKQESDSINNSDWFKAFYKQDLSLRDDIYNYQPGKGILGWHRYEAFMLNNAIGLYRDDNSRKFPIADSVNSLIKQVKAYLPDEIKASDAITYNSDGSLTAFSFKQDYTGDTVVISESSLPESSSKPTN